MKAGLLKRCCRCVYVCAVQSGGSAAAPAMAAPLHSQPRSARSLSLSLAPPRSLHAQDSPLETSRHAQRLPETRTPALLFSAVPARCSGLFFALGLFFSPLFSLLRPYALSAAPKPPRRAARKKRSSRESERAHAPANPTPFPRAALNQSDCTPSQNTWRNPPIFFRSFK